MRNVPGASVAVLTLLILGGCGDESPSRPGSGSSQSDDAIYQGSMNLSRFVYRDINGNGIYDLPDRPYAGQRFTLTAPDGETTVGYSNISGFANFKMSRNNPAHPIRNAGDYQLTATPLDGMLFTSTDPVITFEISELDGSPGGLVSRSRVDPFGVAAILGISGSIRAAELNKPLTVTATGPDGGTRPVEILEDGSFSIEAGPGTWSVAYRSDAETRTRTVQLDAYPVMLSAFEFGAAEPESDTTSSGINRKVRFDNLTGSDTLYEIPNGYGGLDWHNWIATHQKLYRGNGYINTAVSGEFVAYNSSGHPAEIRSDRPFDLIELYMGVAWPKGEHGTISIKAWRREQLVHEDIVDASSKRPLLFRADYEAVTRVEFSASQFWQIVIDNVVYRTP